MLPYKVLRRTTVRPYMTYLFFAISIGVFFWQLTIPRDQLVRVYTDMAITSCQVTTQFFAPKTWVDILRSMFMHGSWTHLFGNMMYLVVFGPAVEEYFGHRRFAAFYLLAGFAAAFSQVGVNAATRDLMCAVPPIASPPGLPAGWVPMIGASGAISGLISGFLLLHPAVKVRVMVPIMRSGFGPTFDAPALFVILFWFGLQLLYGFMALSPGTYATGGVAFWAHIGGFIFGAVAVFMATLFKPAPEPDFLGDL